MPNKKPRYCMMCMNQRTDDLRGQMFCVKTKQIITYKSVCSCAMYDERVGIF